MSNYRIALISHEFPPFTEGGVALNCCDLAYSLSKKGIHTTVFSGKSHIIHTEKLNDHLDVVRLPYLDIPPRFLWFQIQNFQFLLKTLRNYDIVHGVSPTASAIYGYIRKKLRQPFITTIHEVVLNDLKVFINAPLSEWTFGDFCLHVLEYPLFNSLIKTSLKSSDHVIVCGTSAFNDMQRVYPNLNFGKFSVIYNGIMFDRIGKVKENLLQNSGPIVFFGRLVWRKGILHLLKAFMTLKKDFPNLNLDIFGRGPLESKLKSVISKSDFANNIHFRGHVPRVELIRNVKRASIVALPSLYEVGPFISALEAMACKKPIVCFDLPFTREFIKDMHNGVLCKAGDVKDLSDKISLLLSDENLRHKLGRNAYEYVKERHDWDSLVEKYIDIYERYAT